MFLADMLITMILITGSSGFIGGRIAAHLQSAAGGGHSLIKLSRKMSFSMPVMGSAAGKKAAPTHSLAVDLADKRLLTAALESLASSGARPTAIVHCAAMPDLNSCQQNPELARKVNDEATGVLAGFARNNTLAMIYLSTDTVFDGSTPGSGPGGLYTETDSPNPINIYGQTKLAGERHVAGLGPLGVSLRIALCYGRSLGGGAGDLQMVGRSASEKLLSAARASADGLGAGGSARFKLFNDEYRTPVCVADVCNAVAELLVRRDASLIHLGGPERVSRYEFGCALVDLAGIDRSVLMPTTSPAPTPDDKTHTPRPRDVSLSIALANKVLIQPPQPLAAHRDEIV